MNFDIQSLLPENFHPKSRVWIYQCNRLLNLSEALFVEDELKVFIQNWKSHGAPVKGYANLFFGQFLVIIADESSISVGGCSTDSSVRIIKEMESKLNVSFFDRQLLAFIVNDKVQILPLSQIQYGVDNGFIKPDTIYFNNLTATLDNFEKNWMIAVKESWLMQRLQFAN